MEKCNCKAYNNTIGMIKMNSKDAIDIIKEHIFEVDNNTLKESLYRAITALEKDNSPHRHLIVTCKKTKE